MDTVRNYVIEEKECDGPCEMIFMGQIYPEALNQLCHGCDGDAKLAASDKDFLFI